MVPFIILGVGLDDTFIITGAYFRKLSEEHQIEKQIGNEEGKDQNEIITERIAEVMEEVGLSIALTTATTTFAFALGCLSTIPGIQWVCMCKSTHGHTLVIRPETFPESLILLFSIPATDASATIFTDFIFQITLFMAL